MWFGLVWYLIFFSLSSRERMQAPWIINWEIVVFCSRKAIQRVPKITNQTNLPWKWCQYEVCYLPSCFFVCYWHKDILPSEPWGSFSRLFSVAVQGQTAVCTLWIGGPLENYFFFFGSWPSGESHCPFPSPLHCNQEAGHRFPPVISLLFWISLWILKVQGRKMTCRGRAAFVSCCTEMPTGSQAGGMISLGEVVRVKNFP